ncbi:MAG TPA: HNH endonuclease signature motif containing protein, partial [Myxococcales bacterium]|nr:HNH endonuclease signature motif containing protein [Myxococcales bacterium]
TVDSLIDRAGRMTCIELRRELEAKEEVQMCAKRVLDVGAPRRILALLAVAFRAARKDAGRWLPPGECLRIIAAHFIEVWKPVLAEQNTLQKRVLARDRGFCQVPGCSRAATQAHHIDYRSAGGPDEPWNLISLCAAHHLHGVHLGYIRVSGKAPHALRWQLGVRLGGAPLVEIVAAPPATSS